MDSSTLKFHRQLLRHLKGVVTSYEEWLTDQTALLALEALKQEKSSLPSSAERGKRQDCNGR